MLLPFPFRFSKSLGLPSYTAHGPDLISSFGALTWHVPSLKNGLTIAKPEPNLFSMLSEKASNNDVTNSMITKQLGSLTLV